jgi:pantothenate kinase
LIGVDDFETLVALCAKGDDGNVDLTLSDFSQGSLVKVESSKQSTIQEERLTSDASGQKHTVTDNVTFVTLGLLPQLNQEERKNIKKEDIAKSMLHLIAFNITELAYLYAQIHKIDTIIFTGSFINGSHVTQKLMVRGLKFFSGSQGHEASAYFSVHDGFFGALACIKREFDVLGDDEELSGLRKSVPSKPSNL